MGQAAPVAACTPGCQQSVHTHLCRVKTAQSNKPCQQVHSGATGSCEAGNFGRLFLHGPTGLSAGTVGSRTNSVCLQPATQSVPYPSHGAHRASLNAATRICCSILPSAQGQQPACTHLSARDRAAVHKLNPINVCALQAPVTCTGSPTRVQQSPQAQCCKSTVLSSNVCAIVFVLISCTASTFAAQ
jgi:hypothetical protein